MWNRFLAVFLGAFVALFLIGGLEQLIPLICHLPPMNDPNDKKEFAEMIARTPTSAFLCLVFIYLISSFIGSLITSIIAKENKERMALGVGVIVMAGGIANFLMRPHPIWVVVCSMLVYLPAAFLGGKLGGIFRKKDTIQKT
jgi:hypothetical protein